MSHWRVQGLALTLACGALLLGCGASPAVEADRPTRSGALGDRDEDRLRDETDACPDDAEDEDGFADADGCPEWDNDDDLVPDMTDLCPCHVEDRDDFEDQDGCPDPDNDRDRYADGCDRCPNEPETYNGLCDGDGCPDTGGADTGDHDIGDPAACEPVPACGPPVDPPGVPDCRVGVGDR